MPVPDAPSLSFVVGNYNPGGLVPGKFYGANVMHSLLDSVRSTGPAARALCSPTASIDQRADFEALKERLGAGELVSGLPCWLGVRSMVADTVRSSS